MWIQIIVCIVTSIIVGVLYRLGGTSAGTRWRDVGCSLVNLATCLYLGLTGGFWATIGAYFLAFGLLWGAYASYWGLDEKKWGYLAHGLGLSLALLPIAFITQHWLGFGIRCLVNTALICLWSEWTSWDVLEEGGRGFIANATLPLLLLCGTLSV